MFEHPLVEAITTWDYRDGAWLKAPSGFIRQDNSLKPSYMMLKKLIIQEWWTDTSVMTDSEGYAGIEAFKGQNRFEGEYGYGESDLIDDEDLCIIVR